MRISANTSMRCFNKQLKPIEDKPQVYQIVKERFEKEAQMLEDLGEGNQQKQVQPVIHRQGVPIGQLIAIIFGILGIFVAGGLGYFFIQQQQKLNAQIAELQAEKQKQEEESQKEAYKKVQEEQAKLQAEKERLEARNKELEQKANQELRERVVYFTPSTFSRTYDNSSRNSSGLTYQYSCGSPAGSGSVWYAVVGSPDAYSSVKSSYCGDAFKTIPEYGNRVLRVIYNQSVTPWLIVSAYFDRNMKGKL